MERGLDSSAVLLSAQPEVMLDTGYKVMWRRVLFYFVVD
jgi:hypothetical protein